MVPSLFISFSGSGGPTVRQDATRETPFDRVYHVTFAAMQEGSFMGRLGIPFIIGPIAGGERAPFRLRRSMPLIGKARESIRDCGILLQRYSPLMRSALAEAIRIYVTPEESYRLISPNGEARRRYIWRLELKLRRYGKTSDDQKSFRGLSLPET